MFTKVSFLALLLVVPSVAHAAGVTNPSNVTWTAPITNADQSKLLDLSLYNIRVAGPSVTAPVYTPIAYPTRKQFASPVPAPVANTKLQYGSDGGGQLGADLALTADGQYWMYITAVDIAGNESAVQSAPIPFVLNRQAPNVPQDLQVNQ